MPTPLNYATPFIIMKKERQPDGKGGYISSWNDSEEVKILMTLNSSLAAKTAEKQGVLDVYTGQISKETSINFGDYVKRVADGKLFQVTSDPSDNATPSISRMNFKVFSAKKVDKLP